MAKIEIPKFNEQGFTLIEVMVSLMLLAASLVILLGLQSSVAERSIYDDNRKYAMYVAKQILSAIEVIEATSDDPIPDQDTEKDPFELIEDILGAPLPPIPGSEVPRIPLTAHLNISPWGSEQYGQDLMKKIDLRVYWSEDPRDEFHTIFFVPFS